MDELTEDTSASFSPDVTIRIAKVGYEIKRLGEAPPSFHWEDPRGVTMIWPGAAAVRIVSPTKIEIEPHEDCPDNYLPFPLLGPVMGWLLHIRKTYVLHASAVNFDAKSFVFMGDKLAGKSTTAAAFLRAGATLLTDDLLAFDLGETGSPLIQPAFAQLKLSDESSANVHVPGATPLPLVVEGFEKRQYRLDSMRETSEPCDAIFVLKRGSAEPSIEWFDGGTALQGLLRFSYMVRFVGSPVGMQDRQRHFEQAAEIVRRTKVGRLHVPADLDRLDEVVDFVRQSVETVRV